MHLIYIFSRQILNLKPRPRQSILLVTVRPIITGVFKMNLKSWGNHQGQRGAYCEIYCDHFDLIPFRSCMPLYKQIEGGKHQNICLNSTEYTQVICPKQQLGDKSEIFLTEGKKPWSLNLTENHPKPLTLRSGSKVSVSFQHILWKTYLQPNRVWWL